MQPKLTVQERLKDLRVVGVKLTLEELAERTGLSRAALGNMNPMKLQKTSAPLQSKLSPSSMACPRTICWV